MGKKTEPRENVAKPKQQVEQTVTATLTVQSAGPIEDLTVRIEADSVDRALGALKAFADGLAKKPAAKA